jgi:hypothetical protein
MATLVSPGVAVSVTDESFYTSAGPGTVPLIFIATASNKTTPDGLGTAEGTLDVNAGKMYLVSSQRELLQTFGDPNFNEIGGSAQHGYPTNEYGLLAAFSYLGIANRAYVVRAGLDLAALEPRVEPPTAPPLNNTYWLNTAAFVDGLFISQGGEWVKENVNVYLNPTNAVIGTLPNSGFVDGDIMVSFDGESNVLYFERSAGSWSPLGPVFTWAPHTQVPAIGGPGEYWLKTTTPNQGLSIPLYRYNAATQSFVATPAVIIREDHTDYYDDFSPSNVAAGTVVGFVGGQTGFTLEWHNGGSQVIVTGTSAMPTTVTADTVTINGVAVSITGGTIDTVIQDINDEAILGIVASKTATNRLVITNTTGRDVLISSAGTFDSESGIQDGNYSNFGLLHEAAPAYVASPEQPTLSAADGAYWYNPAFDIDIMQNDGTGDWIEFPYDIYIQPDEPVVTNVGDLWVETDQVDDYPVIWRRTATDWQMVDNADQTTPKGIVFADARTEPGAALDADAPNPLLYPGGTLLWNTRYSGRNVKVFRANYEFQGVVIGDRWVTASGNREDGSPYMGLDAVRRVVVIALQGEMQSNEEVRTDTIFYNLLATPGYPELIDEMITLNLDRKEQAFIIGDTPFKLRNTSTELQAWATNARLAPTNGNDGLVSSYPYLGVYYPSGFTSNTNGSEVVVPASHMMLRVMAFNDQVAYPWFAPAGFARGTVTNATSVGYISGEDEFVPITLGEGLRDVLYLNNINPITFIPGRGLVVYGQKTRSPVESALDRVNVARLINYIRFQAERIAQPFLFEPNDSITRAAVKNAFDTFLAELITLRGLFDFLVVCDSSNNTPARIDRNELWVDIAIQPIKAVEFIYIPIRLQNTGADLSS